MKRRLDKRLRARWDVLIETEGTALGLSVCRPFLENKLVNDIFYEGTFKGRPCIVKCSSRAPESIVNEYEMSCRLAAVDSGVCAEALACWRSADGKMAFVVMHRLPGPTLSALLDAGVSEEVASGFAKDALAIEAALERAALVHRDIFPGNLMQDEAGHLRLVDMQFSVDFDRPQPDVWLRRHPKYHYLSLGIHPAFGMGVWNDAESLSVCLRFLPQTVAVREARATLQKRVAERFCRVPVTGLERCRIRLYAVSLSVQMLFRPASEKRERLADRLAKVKRLLAVERRAA